MARTEVNQRAADPKDPVDAEPADFEADDQPKSPARQALTFVGETSLAIVVALVVTALLRVFVFQVFEVPSGSMEHTLEMQDRIAAVRVQDFERGDVVVFEDPPSEWMGPQPEAGNVVRRSMEFLQLLPDSTQGYLVKRAIGMPGDHVVCCNQEGRVTVNGVALDESSYLYADPGQSPVAPSLTPFDVVVPADHLFVMGDHRDRSGDSRLHLCEATAPGVPAGMNGFVPIGHVVGPVRAIVLPFDRLRGFSPPDTFAAVPAGQSPPPAPVLGENTC